MSRQKNKKSFIVDDKNISTEQTENEISNNKLYGYN
jgi:hypothetical protein